LAYLINKKFKGNDLWTTIIVLPMMLSPAVVGNFWTFLYQPQIGLFNYIVSFFTGVDPSSFEMIGSVNLAPWAIVIVDTWMWTPFVMLICLAGLRSIPDYIYEAAECRPGIEMAAVLDDHHAYGAAVLDACGSLPRHRELQDVRSRGAAHRRWTGVGHQLTSINLKREAFEKWRTGYASAYAIILFVTVFGLASIYVKALNKVKER
jgi:multiple sugar transport system permease protein